MKIDFNRNWTFTKSDGTAQTVDLPHDAMIHEKRYSACRNRQQGGYFPGGRYTYSKKFELDDALRSLELKLLFEGVYRHATVYLNGEKIFYNAYGYGEFFVDLTGKVRSGVNEISLDVDNSLVPNCRWYSGSGIYRPVYLFATEKDAPKTLNVRTLGINPAVIAVETDGDEVEIFDGETSVYCGKPGEITVENARLWTAETPNLYRIVARKNAQELDTKFGIRTLEWSGRKGVLVNGKPVKLRGGCIHHDGGVLGACLYKDAEVRRVKILKAQGFNAIRCAHNPASRELLEVCDELGMYVMDEAFDGWYTPKEYHDYSREFYDIYRTVLTDMAQKDYNHPSVILYSLGNEVSETAEKKGIALAAEMRDIVKSVDDTRPVTVGVNVLIDVFSKLGIGIYRDTKKYTPTPLPEGKQYKDKKSGSSFFNFWTEKCGKILFVFSGGKIADKVCTDISNSVDIIGLNYASSRYDKDAKKYPDRLMVGSETMCGELPYNWSRVEKYPELLGDFVWSAWDYLGETCMGWTYQSYKGLPLASGQGMIDITGLPLAQMEYMKTVWRLRDKAYIGVMPLNHSDETPTKGSWQITNALSSWSWHGYEGKATTVEVYDNANSVRLEINGRAIATKPVKKCRAIFPKVKYEPGELTAVSLDENGREIGRSSIATCGKTAKMSVNADNTVLKADGQSLCYLEIEFTDENGNLVPYIEQRVEVEIDGDVCTLAGFGSALTKTDEVFDKNYHDTYRGRALAVIRSGYVSGKATIKISSKGVPDEEITITVE